MRLFAAELMLRINPHDPDGIDVLRGLARQPNREMAIQIATVLQSVLGLQLGLTEGELPQPNTKQAADIARRVLAWANGADPDDIMRPTPGPRAGIKSVSRHSLPAIGSRPACRMCRPFPSTGTPSPAVNIPEPMDESAMLPVTEPTMIPIDDSSLLPETQIPKQVPKPPPLPNRRPSSGSSAVI